MVAGRPIGTGHPCFVIAEAGVNHNGDLRLARRLIDTAVQAGADAVKFQAYKAERLVTEAAPKAEYQVRATGGGESQLDMLRRLELHPEAQYELRDYCRQKGILFLSTPFDEESADVLENVAVSAFKIPSGEITNLPFLAHVAKKGRPMILSTGMATLGEVETALRAVESAGNCEVILLHCVSNYPADPADVNLRAIPTMIQAFHLPVGYSDHTLGIEVPLAAVALGACVIEKHFTLDRALPGPDQQASAEPAELAALVAGVHKVEAALGHGRKVPAASESGTATVARKSLVAARSIRAGISLTEDMIAIKRPGTGLPPVLRATLVGRVAKRDIPADAMLSLEMLA
ncbi:MAG: N-acetylneuraminate synthase [Nitrospirae bacterium]|nr:MAG: N-acetylneuraminate synthase [Nitrospirota bacterium]